MITDGRGFDKDVNKGIECFQKSAGLNFGDAYNALAVCYKNGTGFKEPDLKKAMEYYNVAIDLGSIKAYYNLAINYRMLNSKIRTRGNTGSRS
jgi:TPR repeat protein